MKQGYTIFIEANEAHQPSSGEIHDAIQKLVDNRITQFPVDNNEYSVNVSTHPTKSIEELRAIPSPPRQPHVRHN